MFLLKRILPIIFPLAVFFGLEYVFKNPKRLWGIMIALSIFLLISVFLIFYKKYSFRSGLNFIISPLLLLIGGALFLSFLENMTLKHAILVALVILEMSLLNNIFIYINQTSRYQAYSLENLIDYIVLITAFLFFSSFYVLLIFINIASLQLFLAVLILAALLYYQLIWVNKINPRKGLLYIFISALIIAELFWVISFLPTSHLVDGLILTLVFYIIAGLGKSHLLDQLDFKIARKYLIIGLAGIVVALISASWL